MTKYDSNGVLVSGKCLPECRAGQYRNADGLCVDPSCASLNDCSGAGTCFHSQFTQADHCRCADGYFGADCSQQPDCSAFSNCNGNGACVYNQHFRGPRCSCNPGYRNESCNDAFIQFAPRFDSELGGASITVSHPSGFQAGDTVECRFGSVVVAGTANPDGSANCIAPPSHEVRVAVETAVRKNGGTWASTDEPFFYYPSDRLIPRTEFQLNSLLWPSEAVREINWASSDACLGSTVTISIASWGFNHLTASPAAPVLGAKTVLVASTPNDGSHTLSLSTAFSQTNTLHVLFIEGPRCSLNRYVVPVDASANYTAMCQAWKAAEDALSKAWVGAVPGCPPNRWIVDPNFENYPSCNARNAQSFPLENCFANTGAFECKFSTQPVLPSLAGQSCCYNRNGDLLSSRATGAGNALRFGVGSNRQLRVVAHFVGDVLPGILCCRSSNSCGLFSTARPTSQTNTWVPPRVGGASGDPHFVTLDGKFWTFNGLGEYVLIERTDTDFVLQGRLTRAASLNANAANATVLSGFAVRDAGNVVSGYLGELEGLILFVGGQQVPELAVGTSFQSPNGEVLIFAQADKHVVTLPSGASLEVSAQVSMISLVTLLPASFKTKTRGLLGTWNQNKNDDFTPRTGPVVPSTSSQETLFAFGNGYRATSLTSLFTYPDGEDFTTYNDPTFTPTFVTPAFPSEQARAVAMAACAQAPDVDACLYDVAQTGDIRTATVALKAGAVFQTFASAANTPPVISGAGATVNVRLGQSVSVVLSVTDAENQDVSLNVVTGPEGGSLSGLSYTFTVTNAMFIGKSVVPYKVVAVDEGGSISEPATTNFSVVYSNCENGQTSVVTEASLDLAAYCLASGCSEACAAIVSHVATLDAACKKEVITQLGEAFTAARDKCCSEIQTISCADEAKGGLSTNAIIGIAVGASVGGLLLIGLVVFFVLKGKGGKKDEESEMKEKS